MSTLQNAMGKMTNYRWTICAMLFFATTINYLDRQVLSLTWDEFIKPEFHWNESHYGIITAVFSIVYAICMLFAGRCSIRSAPFLMSNCTYTACDRAGRLSTLYRAPVPAFMLSVEL